MLCNLTGASHKDLLLWYRGAIARRACKSGAAANPAEADVARRTRASLRDRHCSTRRRCSSPNGDVIEAFAANGPNQSFGKTVLPWRPESDGCVANAYGT
jgi:hypothetical protein